MKEELKFQCFSFVALIDAFVFSIKFVVMVFSLQKLKIFYVFRKQPKRWHTCVRRGARENLESLLLNLSINLPFIVYSGQQAPRTQTKKF